MFSGDSVRDCAVVHSDAHRRHAGRCVAGVAFMNDDFSRLQIYQRILAHVDADDARRVVFEFQGTPAVPDALIVMYNSYIQLDLPKDAAATEAVIAENYPNLLAKLTSSSTKTK